MEGFDWQFGYVCGFVTLDYEWVALKRIILRIEQLLRFAMCRLQCRGHHCANVMQVICRDLQIEFILLKSPHRGDVAQAL